MIKICWLSVFFVSSNVHDAQKRLSFLNLAQVYPYFRATTGSHRVKNEKSFWIPEPEPL